MNDIIIHISDLHITDSSGTFGTTNESTLLRTDTRDRNYALIDSLVEKIKGLKCRNRYLIVTGDITDIAEQIEFETAELLINKLISGLSILSENILLIPGDHEIHRDSIKNALRTKANSGKQGYALNNAKYKYFLPFYKKIKRDSFDPSKLIFDQITIGDIIVLGVNSNYKVGQHTSDGFLPVEQFDNELNQIVSDNSDKHILLALHHNISSSYQDKRTGQWIKENRKDLIPIFEKNNVKCIFHGNEHTPKSELLDNSGIYVSDSGALAGKFPLGSYKVYEIETSANAISLKNNIYQIRKINAISESNSGNWITVQANEVRSDELESFDIFLKKPESVKTPIEIPAISISQNSKKPEASQRLTTERTYYSNKIIQNQLYSIVRDRKLFHSGHFHWSESSRAHNWIDVSKLIEKKKDLIFVKNAIVDLINSHNLNDGCDLMISLGTEGNIISSKASIKFDIPYTSLPYSYRYDESHEYTKKLNYSNSKGEFNTVIIITDVVNDGRTLRQLVKEKESNFFFKVKKIIVVSLFYTGQQKIDTGILNYNNLPDDDFEYEVNNIEFYAVFSLKVEKCPYGKDFRDECFIYRDELSCVHLFYDDEKHKTTN